MQEKLQDIIDRYQDIERKMVDPDVISDHKQYQELVKKHSQLKPVIEVYTEYQRVSNESEEAKDLLKDPEMAEMAKEELAELTSKKTELEKSLQILLIPPDPNDDKNVIIEIRSGTGGEEAALFGYELYRMYQRYAETKGWSIDILSQNETGLGGIKEISFTVSGRGVFSRLKFESGTHRVQRVPETESSGRVHTSAVTVAILIEAEEVDLKIDPSDLRIDVYRASGAGGQHVNKTSSAVRITHMPSGVVVACQDERSQFQNKDKAMRLLRSRLFEQKKIEQAQKEAQERKLQVGSGDRSEKIRTYNYPQNRITDHRINLTLYELNKVLEGKLDPLFEALIEADQLDKMKQ